MKRVPSSIPRTTRRFSSTAAQTMRSLLSMCVQDFRRLLANALFWVITATLVLLLAVIHFALPHTVVEEPGQVLGFGLANPGFAFTQVASESALRDAVRDTGALGLLEGPEGLTVLHPGLSDKTVHAFLAVLYGSRVPSMTVEALDPGRPEIPFNLRMVPVFLCFEALITGFILGGALMLSEKEEDTIRALRIAPVGATRYLAAKTLLFSVISGLYALVMAVGCVGFRFPLLPFLLLSLFGSAVYTLLGLAFTARFRDMGSWFFAMALLLSINMLPGIAYGNPSFSPFWIRLIPSYPFIFAYEGILFDMPQRLPLVWLTLAAWCLAAWLAARFMVGRHLFAARRE